ncbi:hypothetical protein CTI12_AA402340 [Artemisia annua]|uniref:RRM domain-containing protein n=1 Tax=Artemisia annua TaxID=35608 RepID=A0A2U1MAB4_ARTAN|nr:hypothetical protein CTI12_AA402340 [Artemisia annua]
MVSMSGPFISLIALILCTSVVHSSDQESPSYTEFVVNATELPLRDTYDYIIVGGGTAGCPLAATLSKNYRVLLLERGGLPTASRNVMTREGFLSLLTRFDQFDSPAQPFTSEDGVPNARGRVLGGSSAINAGFYSRADNDFYQRSGINWDLRVVQRSYEWVEKAIVFQPELQTWQTAVRDGLVEAGVSPFNGYSLNHTLGTKIGATGCLQILVAWPEAGTTVHVGPTNHPGPPPPAVVVQQHSSPMSIGGEEIRTIFISGLPEDVKERELQNLMRWLPGYEASQVNFKAEVPMGFALFSAPHFAIAARDALQDMVFDAESKSVLHTEMAKKNLFVKRGIVADPNSSFDQSKRMRIGGDYTHTPGYSSPSPFHPPPQPVWAPHGYMAPPPPPYDPYGGYPVSQNTKDNPPCNTLFIGNLGESINEEELRGLFTMQPGFKQMKVLRQERHTVCFIEFEDVNSATNVHHSLQGAVIPSSGSKTYSKNPFGKRKDAGYPGSNGTLAAINYQ